MNQRDRHEMLDADRWMLWWANPDDNIVTTRLPRVDPQLKLDEEGLEELRGKLAILKPNKDSFLDLTDCNDGKVILTLGMINKNIDTLEVVIGLGRGRTKVKRLKEEIQDEFIEDVLGPEDDGQQIQKDFTEESGRDSPMEKQKPEHHQANTPIGDTEEETKKELDDCAGEPRNTTEEGPKPEDASQEDHQRDPPHSSEHPEDVFQSIVAGPGEFLFDIEHIAQIVLALPEEDGDAEIDDISFEILYGMYCVFAHHYRNRTPPELVELINIRSYLYSEDEARAHIGEAMENQALLKECDTLYLHWFVVIRDEDKKNVLNERFGLRRSIEMLRSRAHKALSRETSNMLKRDWRAYRSGDEAASARLKYSL
ncbi:hypothetical protein EJ08DRAFT_656759 [Tothia fuscella]|uniref:Uncharacterized protein n=1 Tax=Tothia fuscella TaxID=1048955 RepID=A0A9P4U2Q2_9PEZI|nr:hypothetical protein EJ08DRAFT_656759 [Tothia fuscella]